MIIIDYRSKLKEWWLSLISTIKLIIEGGMRRRLGGVHCQTYEELAEVPLPP